MSKRQRFSAKQPIDCACVIHSNGYDWIYVERLYNMLKRLLPQGLNFHVYTEHDRSVPPYMIKHCLEEWKGISGPKKSWWYKMQLFNPEHHQSQMLYFDLDVVVLRDLQWMFELSAEHFWGIRDFRYLQRSNYSMINSSCMWFNVNQYSYIWDMFSKEGAQDVAKRFHGDQDYITHAIDYNRRRFFPDDKFQSFRWQCWQGGYDFQRRQYRAPNTGVKIAPETSVVVFHGFPKPHECKDPEIVTLWV